MRILLRPPAWCLAAFLIVLAYHAPSGASSKKTQIATADRPLHVYRSIVPLGSEVFGYHAKKSYQTFYILASAKNSEFDGQQLWARGDQHFLKAPSGQPVQHYPREISFRVSVGDRDGFLITDPPITIDTHGKTFSDFITGLTFELKVFHGLDCRIVHPARIRHIGIPPDVPASERVYEVSFPIGVVPISDRLVMHVMTSQGERLAKFNLDMY